ncbi:hypothetical protein [Pseudarthrobacter oxydans]|nr:hypothetical protein GCM10017547_32680 [Pseudarthrobacter oxydans]
MKKKMRCARKAGAWNKMRIVYNSRIVLEGVPEEGHHYLLGSRSALD